MTGKHEAAEKPRGPEWCDAKGQTLRDYFAAHCPDSELPNTVTPIEAAKALGRHGSEFPMLSFDEVSAGRLIVRTRARYPEVAAEYLTWLRAKRGVK